MLLGKLVRKEDIEFKYKETYYRISIAETDRFYLYDVLDEEGKPSLINDGNSTYTIKPTIPKYDEDGKDRVKIIGEDQIIEFIKSQIRGARDHYDYIQEQGNK